MAVNTPKTYRNMVMYSVFVRNFSEEGTFRQVLDDLERIRALGVDIIWLMPIYPVGETARKGTLGSPYAIKNYRAIDPALGTMEDFKALVDEIHAHGMRCIIDVVYNHTSPDSWLAEHHPDWFYHRPDGCFGNRIGDWTDIIDLDYSNAALWDYQIETLKMWAGIVDGFRCDVAPLIPLEFWIRARREVEEVRPGCLWLSESVEPEFIVDNRSRGVASLSDSELFQAFDVSYEYDIFTYFMDYLQEKIPLREYAAAINRQESIYPENFVKLRFLENHDRARAKLMIGDERRLRNWTAFLYFQKGMTLLYAGQERENEHRPSLFEKDVVHWNTGKDISGLLSRLYQIKKDPLLADSRYEVTAMPRDVLLAAHSKGERQMLGVFSLRGESALVPVDAPDGVYTNLIDDRDIEVYGGVLRTDGEPVIIEIK